MQDGSSWTKGGSSWTSAGAPGSRRLRPGTIVLVLGVLLLAAAAFRGIFDQVSFRHRAARDITAFRTLIGGAARFELPTVGAHPDFDAVCATRRGAVAYRVCVMQAPTGSLHPRVLGAYLLVPDALDAAKARVGCVGGAVERRLCPHPPRRPHGMPASVAAALAGSEGPALRAIGG